MKILHMVAFALIVISALNIGLTAVGYNVLEMIFGSYATLAQIIYILIGLSAIFELVTHKNKCGDCNTCKA